MLFEKKKTFYTIVSAAISLHCSKKVFQMSKVFVNLLELRFLYATSFSTSYFLSKTKRSSIILIFYEKLYGINEDLMDVNRTEILQPLNVPKLDRTIADLEENRGMYYRNRNSRSLEKHEK